MDAAVAGRASAAACAGVTVVEALVAFHDGEIGVPADGALIVAEQFRDVVVGVGSRAFSGFVVHVAPLHAGEGVGSARSEPDGPGVNSIGRIEV